MEEINKIDFRLQAFEKELINTVLIDNIPLYDCIVCKHLELNFLDERDRYKFIIESYNFSTVPADDVEEEALFYHNFPQNVMPVDPKHEMIGLSAHATFAILSYPFLESNVFN